MAKKRKFEVVAMNEQPKVQPMHAVLKVLYGEYDLTLERLDRCQNLLEQYKVSEKELVNKVRELEAAIKRCGGTLDHEEEDEDIEDEDDEAS